MSSDRDPPARATKQNLNARPIFALLVVLGFLVLTSITGDARLTPQRSMLENGVTLLTSEQRSLPIVTFTLLIPAGSRYDAKGREGLAYLTARLLTHGTRKRTSPEISETLDFIGASLSTSADTDLASVNLTLLKKDLDVGLELLAEILTASVFPDEEIDRQKQAVIASIRAKEEDPGTIAQEKFLEHLFPRHPYGRPVEGTEDSVRAIERKNLAEFFERFYRPNRAILAVVGDISHQEAVEKLRKAFAPWQKNDSSEEPFSPPTPGKPTVVRVNKNLTQANVVVGHEGVTRSHPDYYAVQVMNYILGGGGFSSRLMESIRNQKGFAYSVYSIFDADKYSGTFQAGMQTKNETAKEAILIAKEEMQRIREEGVTADELQAAKDFLIGSFPLRLDTNLRIASFLAYVEYLELGLEYPDRYPQLIQRVTQQDVARAAKLYLHPERLIVVVVADQEKAKVAEP